MSPIGHDEDGDGVPDTIDVCPHLPGPQVDSDGDGVGDDCDPEPANPRQQVALFATMQPGDQPVMLSSFGAGSWSQLADAVHYDGMSGGGFVYNVTLTNVQITVGLDVDAVLGGSVQHQLALFATMFGATPYDYVELNQVSSTNQASVTRYDGTTYTSMTSKPLAAGVHTGAVVLKETASVGGPVRLEGGWPGEVYDLALPTSTYQGTSSFWFEAQHLEIDLRYVHIVAW